MQKMLSSQAAMVTLPYVRAEASMAQEVTVFGRVMLLVGGGLGGGGPQTVIGDGGYPSPWTLVRLGWVQYRC